MSSERRNPGRIAWGDEHRVPLLRRSEDLDPDVHDFQPDLVEPDWGDAAVAGWGDTGNKPRGAADEE